MNTVNIFIDFYSGDSDNIAFAKRISERLMSFQEKINIVLFSDLKGDPESWENNTLLELKGADIVIPVLTADYLAFITKKISTRLDNLINSRDKYLFPVYFKRSNWSSFNWVVRSKLFPSDSIPLSEYSDNEIDKVISELVKTISDVVTKSKPTGNIPTNLSQDTTTKKENIVFISHDHEDADFAELLKLKLEKEGLVGWIDTERLKIGQDWREEIDVGISNSLAIIAIMTPDARKSEYVTYEWAYAWGKGKKIFPVMLKQTQLHPRLESLQYLDFTNRTIRPWDKLLISLKESYCNLDYPDLCVNVNKPAPKDL